ncbi:MAG: DNA recombination protein RmuC [Oscillospiraceae bacterium]|nr:DNA recombination protein RmuC [Oscillospiraceae bacterium]
MQTLMTVLLVIAIVLLAAVLGAVIYFGKKNAQKDTSQENERIISEIRESSKPIGEIKAQIEGIRSSQLTSDQILRQELSKSLSDNREELSKSIEAFRRSQTDTMESGFGSVRNTMNEKLGEIKGVVDEKMQKTLNERLDSNFKQIGEQLSELYKTLGELNQLSGGVQDLNRTLSNVKTRGIWGEQQLAAILEDTMSSSQYEKNVATKRGSSDRVEFAVRLPSSTGDKKSFAYLPIDSKMPSDIYNKILDASEACDPAAVAAGVKELEQRIKAEAKSISSKYIDPPYTTDFAIMFLPTEGLYAEVLRIDGLSEWCQQNEKIMIAGPTTITALLNSLRVGFANVALNEKSAEVLKLLMAVKAQYQKFGTQIDKVMKQLDSARSGVDELKHRSDIIQKKMGSVGELNSDEAERVLGQVGVLTVSDD